MKKGRSHETIIGVFGKYAITEFDEGYVKSGHVADDQLLSAECLLVDVTEGEGIDDDKYNSITWALS